MATNKRALNLIFCALSPEIFDSVMHLKTAHEAWKLLEVTHEGTNQFKQAKNHLLVQQYESFKMKDGETIQEISLGLQLL